MTFGEICQSCGIVTKEAANAIGCGYDHTKRLRYLNGWGPKTTAKHMKAMLPFLERRLAAHVAAIEYIKSLP